MTRVRFYDTLGPTAAKIFDAPSVGEWLLSYFGDTPKVNLQIYAGEPSEETEVTGNIEALLANDANEYVVLQSPGADAGAFEVLGYILTVASIAQTLFATPPLMPNNVNRTQQSANNALGSRENQVRLLQRVEDIFGTVKAIPSLMMPTYNKYIRNVKYEYGYYCISRGYIQAEDISDGDSLIADLTGSSAAVYWPFTSPNSGAPVVQIGDAIIDPILTVARSNQVDGITLKPMNQLELAPGALFEFTPNSAGDQIAQLRKAPNVNSIINPGDQITIAMTPVTLAVPITALADPTTSGFSGSFGPVYTGGGAGTGSSGPGGSSGGTGTGGGGAGGGTSGG